MRPSALLLAPALLAAAAPLQTTDSLLYTIPAQLLEELGQFAASNKMAAADASSSSSSSSSSSASCTYPARFVISHFTTWAPANTTNTTTTITNTTTTTAPYVAFRYTDADTGIDTACARNASSISLNARAAVAGNAVAGLALRYACDDPDVAFIWQPAALAAAPGGALTLIETACPGRTTTVFEAAGSVRPPAASSSLLQSVAKRGAARTSSHATANTADDTPYRNELGAAGDGTLCWATGTLAGNFTSLQPSPLQ